VQAQETTPKRGDDSEANVTGFLEKGRSFSRNDEGSQAASEVHDVRPDKRHETTREAE